MTIALGILADDGVVIAADTQETYAGVFKVEQGKIVFSINDSEHGKFLGGVSVSGAGTAGHVDALSQEICLNFRTHRTSMDGFQDDLAERVKKFNEQHVVPFATWPEYDRPSVSLLVGAVIGDDRCLWTTDKTAMRVCYPFGAVGIGAAHASLMLRRFWQGGDCDLAELVAAYVLYSVKQHVDGCGKQTQLMSVKSDRLYVWTDGQLERLEKQFARMFVAEERSVLYALGMGSVETVETLRSIRREIKRIEAFPKKATKQDLRRHPVHWRHKPDDDTVDGSSGSRRRNGK